jgi:hypothetical protein
MAALILSVSAGCFFANKYGKLRLAGFSGNKMTIHELKENWEDYDVSYAGYSVGFPTAIMFDPKDDERKLTSYKWVRVKDQETLSALIGGFWVGTRDFRPKVWKILGPNGQLYGYMYTPVDHAVIKVVDETTMWVEDLPTGPEIHGPPDADGI